MGDQDPTTNEQLSNTTYQLPFYDDISTIVQPTEVGESLKELNLDIRDNPDHMMSSIDMRSHLDPEERTELVKLDSLMMIGVCTHKVGGFPRQVKRTAVSVNGIGRRQQVEISVGKRENDANNGFFKRLGDAASHVVSGGKKA